jgi:hypothetical protein
MTTPVDRVVLEFHDGTSAEGPVGMQVTSKGRYSGHQHDDAEIFSRIVCADDSIYDCGTNLVLNRVLLIRSGRNEELKVLVLVAGENFVEYICVYLVLNVDKVLSIANGVDVCILDRMLSRVPRRPFGTASCLVSAWWFT